MVKFEGGLVMPKKFVEETPYGSIADQVYNFCLRDDDIWIVTFPKAGTTWTQETVLMLLTNVDKEEGKKSLLLRSPFLEMGCHSVTAKMKNDPTIPENILNALVTLGISM